VFRRQSRQELVMDEYTERVRRAAQEANGKDLIHNRTTVHAAIIVAELFRKAKASVKILCEDLNNEVYGTAQVIAAATDYLRSSNAAKLEIIVEKDISVATSLFKGD
jgi:hypothetical protein